MSVSFGNYEYSTTDVVGFGAFGIVYKGFHNVTRQQVAIKCIFEDKVEGIKDILEKEIKILVQFQHKNIVQVLACGLAPQGVLLVMEYCNGGDLAKYLKLEGFLSEDTIKIFLQQVASAITVLHEKQVIHRDLKPQNLLLSQTTSNPKPQNITIKIADFGLARHLQGKNLAATVCGTPSYMAPEILAMKPYDAKADLWSIGVIAFECLTGKLPIEAGSIQELCAIYLKGNISLKIPVGTSKDMQNLLLGLLKENNRLRFCFEDFVNHPFLSSKVNKSASARNVVVWEAFTPQAKDVKSFWSSFDPLQCQSIETAYQKFLTSSTSSAKVNTAGGSIDFRTMEETSTSNKAVKSVRRLLFSISSSAAATQVQWEWNCYAVKSGWLPYSALVNECIERHYQNNKDAPLNLQQVFPQAVYTIDCKRKVQINNQTKYERNIQRVVLSNKYPNE